MDINLDFENFKNNSSLKNIKCVVCKSYLSYFPIYINPETHEDICGRCVDEEMKTKLIQNKAYEFIAQTLKFPCRYEEHGCSEVVLATEIPKHEKNCSYRTTKCPTEFFTKCDWQGALPNLIHHCQDVHFDLILKNNMFEMDLLESYHCENLLEVDETFILFTRKFCSTTNSLQYSVCHFENATKKYFFQINFKRGNTYVGVECSTTSLDEKNFARVALDSLLEDDVLLKISGEITVKETGEDIFSKKEKINQDFLAQLVCSVCLNYALPPIYEVNEQIMCSLCKAQGNKNKETETIDETPKIFNFSNNLGTIGTTPLDFNFSNSLGTISTTPIDFNFRLQTTGTIPQIPMIRPLELKQPAKQTKSTIFGTINEHKPVSEIRNLNLDKIANLLDYPCKNEKNGCNFVSKPEQMKCHLTCCAYEQYDCPLAEYETCSAKIFGKDLPTHIQSVHSNLLINPTTELEFDVNAVILTLCLLKQSALVPNLDTKSLESFCKIINFFDHMFRLQVLGDNDDVFWIVQEIGNFEKKFNYEIEIINKNDKQKRLLAVHTCLPLTSKAELFTQKNKFIYFRRNQINDFLSNNLITFKVRVFKSLSN